MTDADRTSAQAEEQEQEQTNGNGGLLGKIVETTKNVVETVAETAKDAVEVVASTVGDVASAAVDKVRDRDADEPDGQALTNAAAEGSTETVEARPVAVAESVPATEGDAAQGSSAEVETSATPEATPAEESTGVVAAATDAVSEAGARVSQAVEALVSSEEPASAEATSADETPAEETSTVAAVAASVRQRVARVYDALTTSSEDAAAESSGEAGASYQPGADGAKGGRPRRFKDVQAGMQLQGKVTSIALYGIFVDVGVGRDGLVHISEMSDKRIDTPTDLVEIGQPVDVWVKSVDPDARRISLTMRDPNRPKPERPDRRAPRKREINRERLSEMKVGDTIEGVISSLANFGAFVDIGVGKDGLVHVSELAEGRVERAEDVVTVGERYTFKVLEVDPEGNRISLSLRRAQRAQRMQQLEPGTVMDGTISGIAPFGAFVDIGVGRDGLIHISELSPERVNTVDEVVKVGDKVQVRVIEVDPNSKRISLTMRVDEPLPSERERPAPRAAAPGSFGGDRPFTPAATGPSAPSFGGPAPSFGGPPPMEDGRGGDRRGGARRGGRDAGRDGGRADFGRGDSRSTTAGSAPRRGDRNDRGGAARPGRGRGEGRRGGAWDPESYDANNEVYTFEDPEEETFTGDATLEDLLTKFNSGKGKDSRRNARDEDEESDDNRRAEAIRRTLALRDEE